MLHSEALTLTKESRKYDKTLPVKMLGEGQPDPLALARLL